MLTVESPFLASGAGDVAHCPTSNPLKHTFLALSVCLKLQSSHASEFEPRFCSEGATFNLESTMSSMTLVTRPREVREDEHYIDFGCVKDSPTTLCSPVLTLLETRKVLRQQNGPPL